MNITCPCNATKISITAEPVVQFWCHCTDCQRAHGAAYIAEALYPREAVSVVQGGTISLTIKTTPRISCAVCGSRLFAELPDIGMRGVNGYLLGDDFQPSLHIHCSDAVSPVADGLPHFMNMPAEFGGDGKLADWAP